MYRLEHLFSNLQLHVHVTLHVIMLQYMLLCYVTCYFIPENINMKHMHINCTVHAVL